MKKEHFEQWAKEMHEIHLPRWEQLPDLELYKDQVVNLVERYLGPFMVDEEKILTPSMINNYVKWKMIPPPSKRKLYNREHVAYLIIITILKQLANISLIQEGVRHQARLNGTHHAYNKFCDYQESAIRQVLANVLNHNEETENEKVEYEDIMYKSITNAYANLMIAKKVVQINREKDEGSL